MILDLNAVIGDWECPSNEVTARFITGRDGAELVQLRVDLGLLQMFAEGRPDGSRYHGFPTVREYFEHEGRISSDFTRDDFAELQRELQQFNYRRLAYACLADQVSSEGQSQRAQHCLQRSAEDIDTCLAMLAILRDHEVEWDASLSALWPTLVFNRGRLRARLRSAQKRFDEAIEEAVRGAQRLRETLLKLGFDEQTCDEDPGIGYLQQTASRIREQCGITLTLREQLDDAIDREDFEAAVKLRDALRRRQKELQDDDAPRVNERSANP